MHAYHNIHNHSFMIPQAVYTQQQQGANPRRRNHHQIHEATMVPALQTWLQTEKDRHTKDTHWTYYGLLSIVEVGIPTNTHDHLVNASCG